MRPLTAVLGSLQTGIVVTAFLLGTVNHSIFVSGKVREVAAFGIAGRDEVVVTGKSIVGNILNGHFRQDQHRFVVCRQNRGTGICKGNGRTREDGICTRIYDKGIVFFVIFHSRSIGEIQSLQGNGVCIELHGELVVSTRITVVNINGLAGITGSASCADRTEFGGIEPNSREGGGFGKRNGFAALIFVVFVVFPADKQVLRTLYFSGGRKLEFLCFAFVDGVGGRKSRGTAGKIELHVKGSSLPEGIEGLGLFGGQLGQNDRIGRYCFVHSRVARQAPAHEVVIITGKGGLFGKRNICAGLGFDRSLAAGAAVCIKQDGCGHRDFFELHIVERVGSREGILRILEQSVLNLKRALSFVKFDLCRNRAVFGHAGSGRKERVGRKLAFVVVCTVVHIKRIAAFRIGIGGKIRRYTVTAGRKHICRYFKSNTACDPGGFFGNEDLHGFALAFIDDGKLCAAVLVFQRNAVGDDAVFEIEDKRKDKIFSQRGFVFLFFCGKSCIIRTGFHVVIQICRDCREAKRHRRENRRKAQD